MPGLGTHERGGLGSGVTNQFYASPCCSFEYLRSQFRHPSHESGGFVPATPAPADVQRPVAEPHSARRVGCRHRLEPVGLHDHADAAGRFRAQLRHGSDFRWREFHRRFRELHRRVQQRTMDRQQLESDSGRLRVSAGLDPAQRRLPRTQVRAVADPVHDAHALQARPRTLLAVGRVLGCAVPEHRHGQHQALPEPLGVGVRQLRPRHRLYRRNRRGRHQLHGPHALRQPVGNGHRGAEAG